MPLTTTPEVQSDAEAEASRAAQRLYEMIAGQWVSSAVRAAAKLGVIDAIIDGATTVREVARETDCSPDGIERLLRVCRSLGLVGPDRERLTVTATGSLLGSGTPGSLKALAELQGTPAVWALWGALPESVRAGRSVAPQLLDQPFFDYLGQHPDEAAVFGSAMRDLTGLVEADAQRIVDLGEARYVIDLGGGTGSFLAALLAANPAARGTVLEAEHVVPGVRETADRLGVSDRLDGQAGDFFVQIPAADYYVLKLVLHDWDDEHCIRILSQCRKAAPPGSRLLVVEAIVDDRGHDDGTADLGALMDMTILTLMNGRERELAEYDALFTAGGWNRTQIVRGRSIYSFIELVATDQDSTAPTTH